MSADQDQARLIAERVARKFAAESPARQPTLTDSGKGAGPARENRRARIIDFISPGPPVKIAPQTSITSEPFPRLVSVDIGEDRDFTPPTQSPWLASWSSMFGQTPHRVELASPQSTIPNPQVSSHPSQERFGVDEAALNELVEFFENEKKCSVDPSGKPCDHCAMCGSRGF
jgi:hypothetical protein